MPRKGYHHTEEAKHKMSLANQGRGKGKKKPPRSEEHRRKLSLAHTGKRLLEETKQKLRAASTGRHHSEESKQKMSLARMGRPSPLRGRHLPEEHKRKIGQAQVGKCLSEDHKRKLSLAHIGKDNRSEEHKEKMRLVNTGRPCSEETRRKISAAAKRRFRDPIFVRKMCLAWAVKPNKPERILSNILNRVFPGEWKYVGDGQFALGGLLPDFVNVNGQKQVIELFGTYWHRDRRKLKYKDTEQGRKEIFAQCGFQTLIIWENELEDIDIVVKRINDFARKENCNGADTGADDHRSQSG